jgi:hypothetical protein
MTGAQLTAEKQTPGIEQCSTARRWNCKLGKELPSKHATINRDRSRLLYQPACRRLV